MNNQYHSIYTQNGAVVVDHPQIDNGKVTRFILNVVTVLIVIVPTVIVILNNL